jgi:hypothetical protein
LPIVPSTPSSMRPCPMEILQAIATGACYRRLEPPERSADFAGEVTEKIFGPAALIQQHAYAVRGRSSDQGHPTCSASSFLCQHYRCGRTSGSWPGHLSQNTRDKSCDAAIKCRGSPLQAALHICPWHPRVYTCRLSGKRWITLAMCCKPVTDVDVVVMQLQMQRSVAHLEEVMRLIYHVLACTHVSICYSGMTQSCFPRSRAQ